MLHSGHMIRVPYACALCLSLCLPAYCADETPCASGLSLIRHADGRQEVLRVYAGSKGELLAGRDNGKGIFLPEPIPLAEIEAVTPCQIVPALMEEKKRQDDARQACADLVSRYNLLQDGLGRSGRKSPLDEAETGIAATMAWDEVRTASEALSGEVALLTPKSLEMFMLDDETGEFKRHTIPVAEVVEFVIEDRRNELVRMQRETDRLTQARDKALEDLDRLVEEVRRKVAALKKEKRPQNPPVALHFMEEPLTTEGHARLNVVNMQHRGGVQFEEILKDLEWSYSLALDAQEQARQHIGTQQAERTQ